ncbi:MAG: hypothetical protein ABI068_03215 [Ktedonobacterales bacterium]
MAQFNLYPVPSCTECGLQSSGRCPTCHRHLCMDHFPVEEHHPCATRLAEHASEYVCYICGAPVRPHQWSTASFAHYIDSQKCTGCHRFICDTQHTRFSKEDVRIARDGMQSHRYHLTQRYCPTCARLRLFGGLIGAAWLLACIIGVVVIAFLVFQFFFV